MGELIEWYKEVANNLMKTGLRKYSEQNSLYNLVLNMKMDFSFKENEEARKRIYKLHQLEGSLTYIERMEIIEEGKGSMEVEFVRGELSEGMTLCFYDNQGKKSGRGEILEIYIGKGEDKGRFSEQGNKGKIIFEYWQPVTDRFWNSQYLKEFTLEK